MKKKVLYGVTLALLGASMVSLQSCKDDLSDFEHRYDYNKSLTDQELKDLWDYCKDGTNSLDKRIAALEAFKNQLDPLDLATKFPELSGKVDDLKKDLYGEDGNGGINGQLQSLINDVKGEGGLAETLNSFYQDVYGDNGFYEQVFGETGLDSKFQALYDQINDPESGLEDRLAALEELLKDYPPTIPDVPTVDLTPIENRLDKLEEDVAQLNIDVPKLKTDVANLQADVKVLQDKVSTVEKEIEAIVKRLDNLITGILVQRAFGPVFGDFSLPIGVQSNLLFGWYGENLGGTPTFPYNDEVAQGLDFTKVEGYINDVDAEYNGEVNLGTLFLTANPIGHNFDETAVSLVASDGTKLPFDLTLYSPKYKLNFGTRSTIENGLYAADVNVAKDVLLATPDVEVKVDNDALKSAVKAAVKDPSTLSAAKLLKAVYDQIDQKLPAYAVRYDWESPTGTASSITNEDGTVITTPADGKYAVISKYEVGVATARPLSYNTLKGTHSSKELPTGNLDNFIDKLKEKFLDKISVNTDLTVGDYKVYVESISFKGEEQIIATVEGMEVNGKKVMVGRALNPALGIQMREPGTFTVYCGTEPSEAVGIVNEAIVEVLCEVTENSDNNSFKAEATLKLDAVLLEMNKQINNVVDQLYANVDNMFSSITGSSYFDRVNKAFDLYNKIVKKLNKVIADPNSALQVAAFYETKDGLGLLSQKENSATPVVQADGSMKIFLTNYTGEFIVPAYKKYFACTNDATVNANNEKLGVVLDGNETVVTIDVNTLESGKTYNFIYQGLDYSGYTSTKKFYIKVK